MKKLQVFALAALVAFGLSSCIKEVDRTGPEAKGNHKLVIRLAGVEQTRTAGAQGGAASTVLGGGHVFVFASNGDLVASVALDPAAAVAAAGQTVGDASGPILVPDLAEVFVVGNIPAALKDGGADDIANLTSEAAILSAIGSVADLQAITLANFPLATYDATSSTFAAKQITTDVDPTVDAPGEASVHVTLLPVAARLELVAVVDYENTHATPETNYTKGDPQDNAFSVTGVFVNGYHPSYTFGGGNSGAIINQTTPPFTGLGDQGEWVADEQTPSKAAVGAGQAWFYNVAAGTGSAPKLVIRVVGDDPNDNEDGTLTAYVSIKGYGTVTKFEPGKIYRIAEVPFDASDFAALPQVPYTDYELTVTAEVLPWTVVELDPEM